MSKDKKQINSSCPPPTEEQKAHSERMHKITGKIKVRFKDKTVPPNVIFDNALYFVCRGDNSTLGGELVILSEIPVKLSKKGFDFDGEKLNEHNLLNGHRVEYKNGVYNVGLGKGNLVEIFSKGKFIGVIDCKHLRLFDTLNELRSTRDKEI